ncbi:MAG: NUDIX domain-containing protein [Clostridia bacterium]|nr:NUDIX domain-containing protein [Clostridia bacterium]
MDIDLKNEAGEFKYRVVGILFDEQNRVLIQKVADNPFYCLPGGRVELGESSIEAVKRELEEELGFDVVVEKPLFFLENFFNRASGAEVHEIGIFFRVTSSVAPKEDWEIVENDKGILKTLRYKWVTLKELENEDLRPAFLKEKLLNLNEDFEQIILRDGEKVK